MQLHARYSLLKWAAAWLGAGAVLLTTHPASATVRANYVETAAWETGYQAQYTITNDGPGDVSTWTVAFDLPTNNTVSSSWDSVATRSAQHLVFKNAAWNGTLAVGTATSFGFVVIGTTRPASCTINGGPCDRLPPLAEAIRPVGASQHGFAESTRPSTGDGVAALRSRRTMRKARRPGATARTRRRP
jgi:hypothetical protein